MDELIAYLNRLGPQERDAFALRCDTSVNYIRKAKSVGQLLRESLCISIERESAGEIRCETLRPDVDWAYIRGTTAEPAKAGV